MSACRRLSCIMQPFPTMGLIASEVAKDDSPFMNLPIEIREMIYRHLVIARFTKREKNMRSREFDGDRYKALRGPDQTHQFFPAIFRTNRKVHEELIGLCQRENNFICFTSYWSSQFAEGLEKCGLELIAKGPTTRDFWNISMTLTLNPTDFESLSQSSFIVPQTTDTTELPEDDQAGKYIFCSDELPAFCRFLLKRSGMPLGNMALCIGVNPAIWKGPAMGMDRSPVGRSRVQKLLEPLRQLHSFESSCIEGPLTATYKDSIRKSVCNDCPTALETISTVVGMLTQGNERMSEGRFVLAMQHYKQALNYAGSCCWLYGEEDFIIEDEPFPGLTAAQVLANLQVRLQACISLLYLKSGMLRMARIYAELALDHRRVFDDLHKTYSLDLESWEGVVYAEALLVSAEISGTHGRVENAVRDLEEADSFVPLNQEQRSRYDCWKKDRDRIRERFRDNCYRTSQRHLLKEKKAEDMLQVVYNRKTKGDQLLRSGRSNLAALKYQAALSKLDLLTQTDPDHFPLKTTTYRGYDSIDVINFLTFKLQANMAASCLMAQKYEEVELWTSTALNCDHWAWGCPHKYYQRFFQEKEHNWKEDQRLDFLKIHYCKAMARKHMGDGAGALEHMEKALTFDPGDNTVYSQLMLLKKTFGEIWRPKQVAREWRDWDNSIESIT
ncbi:hypothetical protein BDR22DRAFT_858927 [Usnea florida]